MNSKHIEQNSKVTSINWEKMHCIRFANEIAIVSESEKDI